MVSLASLPLAYVNLFVLFCSMVVGWLVFVHMRHRQRRDEGQEDYRIRPAHVLLTTSVTCASFLLPIILSELSNVRLKGYTTGVPEAGFANMAIVVSLLAWLVLACPCLVIANILAAYSYRVRSILGALVRTLAVSLVIGAIWWYLLVAAFRL